MLLKRLVKINIIITQLCLLKAQIKIPITESGIWSFLKEVNPRVTRFFNIIKVKGQGMGYRNDTKFPSDFIMNIIKMRSYCEIISHKVQTE